LQSSDPKPPTDVLADDPRASLPARTLPLIGMSFLGWLFFSVRALVTRDYPFSAMTGLAAVLTLGVYLAHRAKPQWTRPLAHVNCGVATVFILLSCQLSGQVLSASLAYLVCVPLAMGYLQGLRGASIWAGVCVFTAVLNDVLMRVMPLQPSYVTTSNDYTIATVVLICLTVGLIMGSERLHAAHVAALQKREATIASLLRGLEKKTEEAEQARDRALEASRAKGEFVATLSHEIRTPLNGVLGMAGLLLDAELPPQQRELVRTIRTSGDALLGLLNDLLDFSKIEAGRLDLERAPFNVLDCVEDAFDLFGVAAANKRLRLACVPPSGASTRVMGDAGRVRQILVNLIGNAVKFTDDGEVVVEVRVTPLGGEAREVSLSVRDTGIGISRDQLDSLFDPFTQASASITRKFGGTGLGLAICRRLAEAMEGSIRAESRLGEGATFHVTLRLDAADATIDMNARDVANKRVVVASSHEATRRMITGQLEMMGAVGVGCETDEELRRAFAEGPVFALLAEGDFAAPGPAAEHEVRIWCPWEDPPRAGAMTLRLPARRRELRRLLASLAGRDEPVHSTPMPSIAPDVGDAPSVLVAEDNPVNQRVVRLMLERMGCRPDVVGTGLEALDALRARPYDLVLMDVRMPEMDGTDATRALRRDLSLEQQPLVVAMTANVQVEDRKACEEAGMDDFIPKPIRPSDLARVIRTARRRRVETAELPPAWAARGP
jgi:signal transduction histidine kinase/CheY-like chemotaxis protein